MQSDIKTGMSGAAQKRKASRATQTKRGSLRKKGKLRGLPTTKGILLVCSEWLDWDGRKKEKRGQKEKLFPVSRILDKDTKLKKNLLSLRQTQWVVDDPI